MVEAAAAGVVGGTPLWLRLSELVQYLCSVVLLHESSWLVVPAMQHNCGVLLFGVLSIPRW